MHSSNKRQASLQTGPDNKRMHAGEYCVEDVIPDSVWDRYTNLSALSAGGEDVIVDEGFGRIDYDG